MVIGREVDRPLWAVMAALEAHVEGLGARSGLQAQVLGRSRGPHGRSWAVLGRPGPVLDRLGWSWAVLGPKIADFGQIVRLISSLF